MTDQTEIRVIELRTYGKNPEHRYAIQYRNGTTDGMWKSLPVVRTADPEHYWRMHGGADD